jgi:hypothetical protein
VGVAPLKPPETPGGNHSMSRRSGHSKFHAPSPGKRHGRHGDTNTNSKSQTNGKTNTNTGTGR